MSEVGRPYDRRRTPRLAISFPVTINWGKKKYNCQAVEFSEFGILLASTHKELVGQEIEVEMAMNSKEGVLRLNGIVAYATDTGLGVRFKDITVERRESLKTFVLSHSNKI